MKHLLILILVFSIPLFFPQPIVEKEANLEIPIVKTVEEEILESMSIEEKVGQLFIFGFDNISLNKETKDFLTNNKIGGVLLLSKNIQNEVQLKTLVEDLQSTNRIPLFITIDQEGGVVARIKWNEILTVPQEYIESSDYAYTIAKSRGELLRSYGINMNFAPVVEDITNPSSFMFNRVYRDNVIEKSISSVKGYKDAQIVSVPKHYPGHSNDSPDSHYSLPVVNITNEQWNKYTNTFTPVLKISDAVMIGHIMFPNIDSKPATISSEIVNKRLIEGESFNGLIISDDMEMDALKNIDTHQNIAKEALLSGIDILIYSKYATKSPTIQKDVYNYILEEVRSGNIDIDQKVLKILRTKIQYSILIP
jgi:beta-N-acetylhexosaminidase